MANARFTKITKHPPEVAALAQRLSNDYITGGEATHAWRGGSYIAVAYPPNRYGMRLILLCDGYDDDDPAEYEFVLDEGEDSTGSFLVPLSGDG